MAADSLRLVVSDVRAEACDVVRIELRSLDSALPTFTPGAHLEVVTPKTEAQRGLVRHYSLCNAPHERDRYVIAVSRAADGRGGSLGMHQALKKGMSLDVAGPRNNFAWTSSVEHYRFVAGGIGITPLMAMIYWCEAEGREWSLLYCTRGRHRTAFYEELRALGNRVKFHFSEEEPAPADLAAATAVQRNSEHLYCCGPQSMMDDVAAAAREWAPGTVHFERFTSKKDEAAVSNGTDQTFDIVLRRGGQRITVPPKVSILEALEQRGIDVPYSCREGLCRTCETPLCSGEADHRDCVLSDEERAAQRSLMICVSRARSPVLELDL